MRRSLKRSNEYFQRAVKSLPLGVASNFRYWGDDRTLYVKRARGARLWDIDDNEYIDYRLVYGPAILGYADERVDDAARAGMDVGGVFALATEKEAVVAERMIKMVKSLDLVRFSISGTEAVMAALRLARAHSGRDGLVMVEGGYHGMSPVVQWQVGVEYMKEGQTEPKLMPFGEGVPMVLKDLVHVVPLNDANKLEEVFQKHRDRVGAFLIEPILGNAASITADAQYVKDARELCTRYEIVMVIDEVKTGFRVAKGGVQQLMGVDADLCTFAKAMANGYPISAVGGREDIMRRIGFPGVAHGGTYTAHSVCIAAAEKTLEILDETDALKRIEDYGSRLQAGLSEILSKRGIPHVFTGHPSMGGLFFAERAPANYRAWKDSDTAFYAALVQNLHDFGLLVEPDSREPMFISTAHDEACLADSLERFESALKVTLD
jgi:glutamate-1-semialdehyde 2,1-aminomutase